MSLNYELGGNNKQNCQNCILEGSNNHTEKVGGGDTPSLKDAFE